MITEFVVGRGERVKRLDAFLVNHERGISRSRLKRLIVAGRVRINAEVGKPSQKVKPGDRISLDKPEPGPLMVNDEPGHLDVLYEDETLLVVNKPAGVVVHPTSGHWQGTLLNGLLEHLQLSEKKNGFPPGPGNPGLVHRLDKETSGVMVVAKTPQAHRALSLEFEKRTIVRRYEALVYGKPVNDQGTINVPTVWNSIEQKKVSNKPSKPQTAVTDYRVLQHCGNWGSRIELIPHTGRRHQLRVHMATIGCPIVGDQLYSGQKVARIEGLKVQRMMLHAKYLRFLHPGLKIQQEYFVEVPAEFWTIIPGRFKKV